MSNVGVDVAFIMPPCIEMDTMMRDDILSNSQGRTPSLMEGSGYNDFFAGDFGRAFRGCFGASMLSRRDKEFRSLEQSPKGERWFLHYSFVSVKSSRENCCSP